MAHSHAKIDLTPKSEISEVTLFHDDIDITWQEVVSVEGDYYFLNNRLGLSTKQAHLLVDALIYALDKQDYLDLSEVHIIHASELRTPRPTVNDQVRNLEESQA